MVTIIPMVFGREAKTVSASFLVDESSVIVENLRIATHIDVELGTEEIELCAGIIERARMPLEGDDSVYRWWSVSIAFEQKTLTSDQAHVSVLKREDNTRFLSISGDSVSFGQRVHCGCSICKLCGAPI